jgi:beta-propeller repeat-containing protein
MKRQQSNRAAFLRMCMLLGFAMFFAGVVVALFAGSESEASSRETARVREHGHPPKPALTPSGGVQQAWVARYNGPANDVDVPETMDVDDAGNVYVSGYSAGSNRLDYATVKYDSAGLQQWVARYNGPANDYDIATAIAVDDAGNVYVTGESVGSGTTFDYATIKYDSAGNQQWVARYNGPGSGVDEGTAIAVDDAGNVYVTGNSVGSGTGADYATIKYDAEGQQQWVARYNGPGNAEDIPVAIEFDSSGSVYVTGHSFGSGSGYDYATVKYDSAGQQQWVARYNGPGNGADIATDVAVDGSGNVYVTGGSTGSSTGIDIATIKYNSSGQEQWVARYNGPENSVDYAEAIAIDDLNNVYVAGASASALERYDFATVKYDAAGQQAWVAEYSGTGAGDNQADEIEVDSSGSVYVTGESLGFGTGNDYATVKYDSSGQEQWVARYDGPASADDFASGLAIDSSNNVYVTGRSTGSGAAFDYATVKYVQAASPTPTPTATATPTPSATPTATPRPTPQSRPRPTPHPRP